MDDLELTSAPADGPSDRRRQVAVTAGVTVGVLALLGGLLVLTDRGDDDAAPRPTTSTTSTPPEVTTPDSTPGALLELMPAGPMDGKESWGLPVLVTPQAGVADAQVVTVLGRGFDPLERVGIVMCTSEADVEGVAACELGVEGDLYRDVTYANADEAGSVVADVTLRQLITTPYTGPVDCVSAAERCLVAIGAVSDYDRSGGSFVGFAGAPPFAEPVLSVDPPGPYEPGQVVTVTVTGLPGPRRVQLSQCQDDRCEVLHRADATHDGTFTATVTLVGPMLIDQDGQEVPCDGACVLRLDGLGLPQATTAPLPWPASIAYLDETRDPVITGVPDDAPDPTPAPTPPPDVATTAVTTLVPTTPVTTVSASIPATTSG